MADDVIIIFPYPRSWCSGLMIAGCRVAVPRSQAINEAGERGMGKQKARGTQLSWSLFTRKAESSWKP